MSCEERIWPAIVIGGGAAGLMAAIFAARAGVPVLVVETRLKPGTKIRISGGGRCNVLPTNVRPEDFHTSGSIPRMRNVLLSWPLEEVYAFFEQDLGVGLKVEPPGKVFPQSGNAKEVVGALLRENARSGARVEAPFRVADVRKDFGVPGPGFVVDGAKGGRLHCRRLALATGGLSLPKSGSDGFGLEIARSFGHRLVPTYPALVPLLTAAPGWRDLRGLSVPVRLAVERRGKVLEVREGDMLFTHRGFSGPVVLDLSHHVTRPGGGDNQLRIHWGGSSVGGWDTILRSGGRTSVGAAVRRHIPNRLAALLVDLAGVVPGQRLSELSREARKRLVDTLEHFLLPVAGSEGYKTAEVTGGGVPLTEVATKTLESRLVPGLYFCGEILDVTGRLGGYNFLWAWVTGRKVGQALAAAHTRDTLGSR